MNRVENNFAFQQRYSVLTKKKLMIYNITAAGQLGLNVS